MGVPRTHKPLVGGSNPPPATIESSRIYSPILLEKFGANSLACDGSVLIFSYSVQGQTGPQVAKLNSNLGFQDL
jgi:hypothetical protein